MKLKLIVIATSAALIAPASASACSCAPFRPADGLRGWDGAVIAKLRSVEPLDSKQPFGKADFTYRVNRVFKGRHPYDLRAGVTLVIRGPLAGATCGLSQRKRRYGLLLYKSRRKLAANLCTAHSPRKVRRAARARSSRDRVVRAAPGYRRATISCPPREATHRSTLAA